MRYQRTEKYAKDLLNKHMMGPNALLLLEELTANLSITAEMTVMDLGCGEGLTSFFLAKEFGAQIHATDLWIAAEDNARRFEQWQVADLITAVHADAAALPYQKESFDLIVSIDSYHYFGREEHFYAEKIEPLLRPGGMVAIAIPGFKKDIHGHLPAEILLSWTAEDMETFHDIAWWKKMFVANHSSQFAFREMDCFTQAWDDWLATDNPYAKNDKIAMDTGAGQYMNFIGIIGQKNKQ